MGKDKLTVEMWLDFCHRSLPKEYRLAMLECEIRRGEIVRDIQQRIGWFSEDK